MDADPHDLWPAFQKYGKALYNAQAPHYLPLIWDDSDRCELLMMSELPGAVIDEIVGPNGAWERFAPHPYQLRPLSQDPIRQKLFIAALWRPLDDAFHYWSTEMSRLKTQCVTVASKPPAGPSVGVPERRKPGPTTDRDTAWRVRQIVDRVMTERDGDWKASLDDICKELDKEQIPRPKPWGKKGLPSWSDAADMEPGLAKKAIAHHLKNAQH
jgi:hypothetical protein